MADSTHFDFSEELTQAVWRFNFRPDSYLHPSWMESLPAGTVVQALSGKPHGEGRLVRYLMQELGLSESVFFDFGKPLARLALWRTLELEKLVLYIGAVFHYQLVRRVVTKDDLIKIRELLGDNLWRFMQQRAPVLTHNVDVGLSLPANMGMKKRFILIGMLCLRAAFIDYPETFWQRMTYKLERDWYVLWKHHVSYGQALNLLSSECAVLVQKIAIEVKMGMSSDGKILFN